MPTSRSYISQRLRLHYADWGNDSAPPLLLVHGGRDHCRAWDWVAERLSADYHVIAPDLRGHGDSDWADAGGYVMPAFIYDLAQLIHQQTTGPVALIGHSLGGNIATRYTGLYPERVSRLVCIEGLGPSPKMEAELAAIGIEARLRGWIDEQRQLAARQPRRYATLLDALARMRAENAHLSESQADHLTRHGVRQNEDGTYTWKFDPYIRSWPPIDSTRDEIRALWQAITCPTLLIYGAQSWASNPGADGRAAHFPNAAVQSIEGAAHWVHHDQLEAFLGAVEPFLANPAASITV
jgi:pimeloyl-ACP methyl ester carboxylesterase